ncbi:MAG TPA: hypothetical protein ENG66_05585 [Thermococcus sp.]|nr:hypothetical protein [Thermococcus sp.]
MLKGILYRKIVGFFKRRKKGRRELFVKTRTPQEYRRAIRVASNVELAEKTREVMNLRKRLEEALKYIEALEGKMDKETERMLMEEKKRIEKIKRMREYKRFFKRKTALVMVSAYTNEPFLDANGEPRPFWVGEKWVATPYGIKWIPLLAKKKGDTKDIAELETTPPVYLDRNFADFFAEPNLLVYRMKTSGVVPVNVTPDGHFIRPKIPIFLSEFTGELKKEEKHEKGRRKRRKRK